MQKRNNMSNINVYSNIGKSQSLGLINNVNTLSPKSFGIIEKKGHYTREELNKIMDIVSIQMIDMGVDDPHGVVSRLVMIVLDSCFECSFTKFELKVEVQESDKGCKYTVYDSMGVVSVSQWVDK